jgi:NADH-quinone oxidoreductase subunit J
MIIFAILSLLTVAGAVMAMSLRNLVHCALALTVAFAGLAGLYLQLDAEFVGFAQVLVYIGAVAILIVFAILLTRGGEPAAQSIFSSSWVLGAAVAVSVFGVLGSMIWSSPAVQHWGLTSSPAVNVLQIGEQLMTRFILPLEVLGLLLTAALIGAVLIAMRDAVTATEGNRETTARRNVAKGVDELAVPTLRGPIQGGKK